MLGLDLGTELPDPLAPYLEVDRTPRHECWVTGHMVAGLDGSAAVAGRVGALSTAPDQQLFRRMRQIADVVLVGAETVRRERYGPVRLSPQARSARERRGQPPLPAVAVVSASLAFDWTATLFTEPDVSRYLITCANADAQRRAIAEQYATVIVAGVERVEPAAALRALAGLGFTVVLCEGGPTWLGELIAADRLDELCLSIAPLMGGDPLPVAITPEGTSLIDFDLRSAMTEDHTLFLRYQRRHPTGGRDG